MRVNLEAVERGIAPGGRQVFSDQELRALVAELRAAREVIDEADSMAAFLPLDVVEKLGAYHEAVA
jgi:hypothetical protein